MAENQRNPYPLPPLSGHGHRKLTATGGMLLAGEVGGQEAMRYIWDSIVLILNRFVDIPLAPMPEDVAVSLFSMLAMVAFYQTTES